MTTNQFRLALKANYHLCDNTIDEMISGHDGDFSDMDYINIAKRLHNNRYPCGRVPPREYNGIAEDDLVNSYDNNFKEWR